MHLRHVGGGGVVRGTGGTEEPIEANQIAGNVSKAVKLVYMTNTIHKWYC